VGRWPIVVSLSGHLSEVIAVAYLKCKILHPFRFSIKSFVATAMANDFAAYFSNMLSSEWQNSSFQLTMHSQVTTFTTALPRLPSWWRRGLLRLSKNSTLPRPPRPPFSVPQTSWQVLPQKNYCPTFQHVPMPNAFSISLPRYSLVSSTVAVKTVA